MNDQTDYSAMGTKQFWTDLCPNLTISDLPIRNSPEPARNDRSEIQREKLLLLEEGHLRFESLIDRNATSQLADGVRKLVESGIPTPFLFVYDEAWQLFGTLRHHITALVGERFLVGGDMWVWHVPPNSSGRGWAPHRDDQYADSAFAPNGDPNLISLWIALTDATVDNGCIYVLPKTLDPGWPKPKTRNIPSGSLAGIRAQPVSAGSVLSWTADVLHWGAQSTPRALEPRISLCLYAQRDDAPRFATDMITLESPIPLQYRLGFIARTMIRYRSSTLHPDLGMSPQLRSFCIKHEVRLQKWLEMMSLISES